MKIAVVMPLGEQRGGGELMLLHLLRHGRAQGVTWQVIFLEDGPLVQQIAGLGVQTTVITAGRLRQPHRVAGTIVRIAAAARRERVDALLSWMTKAHLYGGPAALLARIPALWYHLAVPSPRDAMDRLATRLPARGILTLSRAAWKAQARLRPRRVLRLVYPGAELDRFDPAMLPPPGQARRLLGLPETGPLIVLAGRLQRWKGMHVLVEAMPQVLAEFGSATAVLVGGTHDLEPDYPDYLRGRIASLGLEGRVILAGLQSNVALWMQAADVVVHASDAEPFGIVVVEAMALNKPVVAGDAGGPAEIITHGENGLLAPYGDPDALAGAVLTYLRDPQFARHVGAAAGKRAQDFSAVHYAHNVICAVRDLLPDVPEALGTRKTS